MGRMYARSFLSPSWQRRCNLGRTWRRGVPDTEWASASRKPLRRSTPSRGCSTRCAQVLMGLGTSFPLHLIPSNSACKSAPHPWTDARFRRLDVKFFETVRTEPLVISHPELRLGHLLTALRPLLVVVRGAVVVGLVVGGRFRPPRLSRRRKSTRDADSLVPAGACPPPPPPPASA